LISVFSNTNASGLARKKYELREVAMKKLVEEVPLPFGVEKGDMGEVFKREENQ